MLERAMSWLLSALIVGLWALIFAMFWIFLPYGMVFWLSGALAFIHAQKGAQVSVPCFIISTAIMTLFLGIPGGIATILMLAPAYISISLIKKGRRFWESTFITSASLFVASIAVVSIGQLILDSNISKAIIQSLFDVIYMLDNNSIDQLLTVSSALDIIGPAGGMLSLSAQERVKLLIDLENAAIEAYQTQLPSIIIVGCGFGGLLATFLPRYSLRRRGAAEVDFPDIAGWRMSKRARDGISVVILIVLAGVVFGVNLLADAYIAVCDALLFVCAVQGVAVSEYYLRYKGTGKVGRFAIIALTAIMFSTVLSVLGVVDMFLNIRRYTHFAKLTTKEEDNDKE